MDWRLGSVVWASASFHIFALNAATDRRRGASATPRTLPVYRIDSCTGTTCSPHTHPIPTSFSPTPPHHHHTCPHPHPIPVRFPPIACGKRTGIGWGWGQVWWGWGGDWKKLVGMGWVWGEQVVPVQLSTCSREASGVGRWRRGDGL